MKFFLGEILMNVLNMIHEKLPQKVEIKATLCYFISNVFTKAFGFLTIPLYTHFLSTAEYGYLNTYNAWVNLLGVFMGMSLGSAIMGKMELCDNDRNAFQSSVMTLSLLSATIITFIVVVSYILIYGQINVIVFWALAQGYGAFVISFVLQEWVLDNKYVLHSIVSVGSTAIPILITCLIIKRMFQGAKYLSIIIPRACIVIFLMLVFVVIILARGKMFYNKELWLWSLKYCIPIVFHSVSLTIMLQADRIMLSHLYGYSESGIYSFIYNVTLVIGVLIAALENTWKTWFFHNYECVNKKLIQMRCRLFILVAIIGVSIYIFIAPELVRILADKEYHAETILIGPIAFAYIISFFYDFLVYVEYKKKATKSIAMASIIAALINVLLNFIVIPQYGGIGAACTTCVAYAMQLVLHLVVVRTYFRLPFLLHS